MSAGDSGLGAQDLFTSLADPEQNGVVDSVRTTLGYVRKHVQAALESAKRDGSHDDLRYNFQAGAALLMPVFDSIAIYVEKKIRSPHSEGDVYWADERTFQGPGFENLREIKDRTNSYVIPGGVTADSVRNLVKHYIALVPLSAMDRAGHWELRFQLKDNQGGPDQTSGGVLRGLIVPLFNDACEACTELAKLMGQDTAEPILPL